MDKIKEGQVVSTSKLKLMVASFHTDETQLISILRDSRYSHAHLLQIDASVLQDCIFYCVSEQIKSIMVDKDDWHEQL